MKKKVMAIILVILLLSALVGCASGKVDSKVVGTWNNSITNGVSITLERNGDYSFTTLYGTSSGTFEAEGGTLTLKRDGGGTTRYSYSFNAQGNLLLDDGDGTLFFTKVS